MIQKPKEDEFAPYYQPYIDSVPEGDFIQLLGQNQEETITFLFSIPEDKQLTRYAPNKWSIKEVLIHMIDVERMMSHRAFVAARGDDKHVLHSFDDKAYVRAAHADSRDFKDLIVEFLSVRNASLSLFHSITSEQSSFKVMGEKFPFTARACAYIILGHTMHHVGVIKEKYLTT